MCLIVKKGTRTKIAKEDIVCYKYVRYDGDDISCRAQYQDFYYTFGELYTTTFSTIHNPFIGVNSWYADNKSKEFYSKYFDEYNQSNEITVYQEGFHSYKNIEDTFRKPNVKCLIPKGTRYIEDETGLICSEAIIIVERL